MEGEKLAPLQPVVSVGDVWVFLWGGEEWNVRCLSNMCHNSWASHTMGLMFRPKCIFKLPASPCFLSPAFSPFCNSVSISLTALKIAVIQASPVINLTTSLSFLNSGSLPESVSASFFLFSVFFFTFYPQTTASCWEAFSQSSVCWLSRYSRKWKLSRDNPGNEKSGREAGTQQVTWLGLLLWSHVRRHSWWAACLGRTRLKGTWKNLKWRTERKDCCWIIRRVSGWMGGKNCSTIAWFPSQCEANLLKVCQKEKSKIKRIYIQWLEWIHCSRFYQ